uniref:Uncharacterized protein n=1 Tax=Mesocestoides corti TaxID=53468 RepID=A0A5K3ESA2_MESCO
MSDTGTREKVLLTYQKPEPYVWQRSSESTTLATPLIFHCSSFLSTSGWLLILHASRLDAETQDWLRLV